jgi:hypothetical protein
MAKNEKRVISKFDVIQNSNHEWKKKFTPIESGYVSFYRMICNFLKLAGVFRVFKVHSTTRLVRQTYNVASNSMIIVMVCFEKYRCHGQKGLSKFTEA